VGRSEVGSGGAIEGASVRPIVLVDVRYHSDGYDMSSNVMRFSSKERT